MIGQEVKGAQLAQLRQLAQEAARAAIRDELGLLMRESLPASLQMKTAQAAELRAVERLNVTSRTLLTLDDKQPAAAAPYLSVDANGFAQFAAGPVGATGPAGPTGPTGPAGAPNSLNSRLAAALLGTGMEGFALYAALREAQRVALAVSAPYLVSWPYDPRLATAQTLTNGRLTMTPVIVPAGEAIDGCGFVLTTTGAYTAANENRVAVYSFDGTTFTRLGMSTNNGNLWKPVPSYQPVAFTAQVAAAGADRLLWMAALYGQSAQPTPPQILGIDPGTAGITDLGLSGLAYSLHVNFAGVAAMPATILATAGTAGLSRGQWLAPYRTYV